MAAPVIRHWVTPADGTATPVKDLGVNCDTVRILNRDTTGIDLFVCIDGVGGPGANGVPTVEGNDCEIVPSGCERTLASPGGASTTVRAIATANAAVKFSVRGNPQ